MSPTPANGNRSMDDLVRLTRELNLHVPPSYFPSASYRVPYEEAIAPVVAPDDGPLHLYVGVPLCEEHCRFCMYFYGLADPDGAAAEACTGALERFLGSIRSEVDRPVAGMYVGGGTPSVLDEHQIERLLVAIRSTFELEATSQLTFEVSPRSFTPAKAAAIAAAGVGRVSFGVQSFDPEPVRRAGRGYVGPDVVAEVLASCRRVGIDEINADLMVGLDGEGDDSLVDSVRQLLDLGCPTVSIYRYRQARLTEVEAEGGLDAYVATCAERVRRAVDHAVERGREVSGRADGEHVRLVAPGPCPWPERNLYETRYRPSLRNSLVGIGSGGRSFLRDEQLVHCEHRRADGFELSGRLVEVEECDEPSRASAALVNALFRDLSVDLDEVTVVGGVDPIAHLGGQVERLVDEGVLERSGTRLTVLPEHRDAWAYWDKLLYPEGWLRQRERSRRLRVR